MLVTTTCAIRSFTEHNRRKSEGEEQNTNGEFSVVSFWIKLFSFTRCYYQRVDDMIVNSNHVGTREKRKRNGMIVVKNDEEWIQFIKT